ncbi:hypothetical protein LUW76_21865 [Actinomadura madurae]|uniref:hypothetical protein n=1 Tax=Actinomadura madurae TaxID=1993 RepID=UPI0020275C36|nr:hypothetical protein [Actinomadura madurae]URN01909.1 hypothetical protein LUW76_21865 [Actinomadura madurae]
MIFGVGGGSSACAAAPGPARPVSAPVASAAASTGATAGAASRRHVPFIFLSCVPKDSSDRSS